MLINERTAISTNKLLLVPYSRHHVTTYHDWMKDPVIPIQSGNGHNSLKQDMQVATASEPLSIGEEYAMQQSWRSDSDKLTFILCLPSHDSSKPPEHTTEIASMIGDVNMFVSVQESDDNKMSLVGELELMIAIKDFQRKGLGRSALLIFVSYILGHEKEIIKQYEGLQSLGRPCEKFDYLAVKINEENARSLSLFEGVGFEKTSPVPSFFGEYELRNHRFDTTSVGELLSKHGIRDYTEIEYDSNVPNGD